MAQTVFSAARGLTGLQIAFGDVLLACVLMRFEAF